MDSEIEGQYIGDYLSSKGVVPFLELDKGQSDEAFDQALRTTVESIYDPSVNKM